jgi:hypothetical protein
MLVKKDYGDVFLHWKNHRGNYRISKKTLTVPRTILPCGQYINQNKYGALHYLDPTAQIAW